MDTIKVCLTIQSDSIHPVAKAKISQIGHLFSLCILILTSCATPSEHFAKVAFDFGFSGLLFSTGLFDHQLYTNAEASYHLNHEVLYVYLDGDGSPWEQHRWIADDPTSTNPMILELMQQDNNPSIFLGRPCYHGFNNSAACHFKYWTSHRYSREVINSMALALKRWLQQYPYKKIVLIGFSGGGTLAVLMAPELPGVQTVVTVAANLDVDAWSLYHRYLPLSESLNPATLSLNTHLKQIHIVGLNDTIVPAGLIKAYADKQVNATYISYPHFDHHCCWVKEWPAILSKF